MEDDCKRNFGEPSSLLNAEDESNTEQLIDIIKAG